MSAAGPVCWVANVRRMEDGFFTAQAAPPRQGGQFSIRTVEGMPAFTHFSRLQVDGEGLTSAGVEIWVVSTALPTGNQKPPPGTKTFDEANFIQVQSALVRALPAATLCFTTEDREGFARLIGDPERAPAMAAAISVVKYYGSWDESDPIEVIVGDEEFAVSVGFTDNDYPTTVRRKSPGAATR